MKKLIITSLTFLSLAISNSALAESNFDGFYAGLGAGHGRATDKGIEYKNNGSTFEGVIQRNNPEGNFLSVFGGFNKVLEKNILLGAEADYDRRSYSHASVQEVNGRPDATYPVTTKVKNGESLRARFGYIFNQDKTLAYLTTGFARIKVRRDYGDGTNTSGNGTSMFTNTHHKGYVAGFGIEHFLTKKISLRGEYRYTRYLARYVDTSLIYSSGTVEKQRLRDQSIRIGIVYNF